MRAFRTRPTAQERQQRPRRARAGREGLSEPPAAGSADGTRRARHSDAGQSFRPQRARCSGGVSPLRAELGPSFPRREASLGPIPGRAALPQEPEGPALATRAAAERDDTSFRPARPQRPPADGRLPAAFREDAASHRGPRGLPRCPAHSHSRARRRSLALDSEVPLVCSANTTQAPGPFMSAHLTK